MAQRDPGQERVRLRGAIAGGIVLGLAATGLAVMSFGGEADNQSADPKPARVSAAPGVSAGAGSAFETSGDDFEPGSLKPVRAGKLQVREPVGLYKKSGFGTGVTARVTNVEAVQGKARGPGEISGPALRLTVTLSNASDEPIEVPESAVGLTYGTARTPAITLSEPGVRPFPTVLENGTSATAKYVFAVPPQKRRPIRVSMAYSAELPTLVFKGPAN